MTKKTSDSIFSLRTKLSALITDWKEDGSTPSNYIRETGMGKEVARVDRWCGGYQNTHEPVTIGWRAQQGNRLRRGVILVDYDNELTKPDAVKSAINKAKTAASKALKDLGELE